MFPASSPYVLAVGATSVEPSSTSIGNDIDLPICQNSEYNCDCSTSKNEQIATVSNTAGFDTGGGFSLYSPRPKYQTNAIRQYLKNAILPNITFGWNPYGRGYPDIGAVGEGFCTLSDSSCDFSGGTSASAPLIASLITLLNNDRMNANKSPLGFVNPLIYYLYDTDSSKYFNNQFETANNNGDCGDDFGFNSVPGLWSPMVGCGSPKFDQIRAFVATLP